MKDSARKRTRRQEASSAAAASTAFLDYPPPSRELAVLEPTPRLAFAAMIDARATLHDAIVSAGGAPVTHEPASGAATP